MIALSGVKLIPSSSNKGEERTLGFPPHERIFALDHGYGLYPVRAGDDVGAHLAQSEMADFTDLNQILHYTGYVRDRHVGIVTMLENRFTSQPPERSIGNLMNVLCPAP